MYDIAAVRIAVGILALLAIVLLPVRQDTGRCRAYLGFLAGLTVLFCLVRIVVTAGDLVVDSGDDRIIRYNIDQVRALEAAGTAPKNMLLVDGSSQSMLGLNPNLIRERLKAQGYDVQVLLFVEGGANTMERHAMLQRFSREMRRVGLAYGDNTRLMLELHPGYESQPARFFERNDTSIRSYYYPSLGNILTTAHIYRELGVRPSLAEASTYARMYAHSVMWDLKIGFAPMLRPFDRLDGETPFHPNRHHIGTRSYRPYHPDWPSRHSRRADLTVPMQLTFDRAARDAALFDGIIKGTVFFLMPSLDRPQLKYGHRFCVELKGAACIDGSAPEVRAAVNGARFYTNASHLSAAGADIYSRYFAEQLIAQGVVVK